MKKRFALYGMFAAMAIFATACGDDSSSGPEEESSSSIEAEDESSSSVEEEGKSSAKEEGKSSAADKKSSSSEAKKGDSSSSEKATSSSSEAVSSSSHYSTEPTCTTKTEGKVATAELTYYGTEIGDVRFVLVVDYDNFSMRVKGEGTFLLYSGCAGVSTEYEQVKSCSDEKRSFDAISTFSSIEAIEEYVGTLEYMENDVCEEILSFVNPITGYLNSKMLDEDKYGTFRDTRDAMLYYTIEIGNQTWMAQNLNYVTHGGNADDGVASWCYDDAESCAKYGRLYTWAAAMDKPEGSCGKGHVCGKTGTVQGICPDGWHLPSKEELHKLLSFASTGVDSITTEYGKYDYDAAGTMLRNPTEWTLGEEAEPGVEIPEGLDKYGFSVLPAGYYDTGYIAVGSWTYFWSSSEIGEKGVYMAAIGTSYSDETSLFVDGKGFGQSVRCIKDDAPSQSVSSN